MLISCTKRVLDKIAKVREVEKRKVDVGFYNWYADSFKIGRRSYILYTHSETLFSFIVYSGTKKEYGKIEELFEANLQEIVYKEIGDTPEYLEELLKEKENYTFLKTNSRMVLGSMTDFKYQIEVIVGNGASLEQVHHSINKCPMGGLKYKRPSIFMKEELDKRISKV